ncbi:MAG: hypothetical protein ACI4QZ_06525 [Eubacteriales bacterium]
MKNETNTETERKFLIKYPSKTLLEAIPMEDTSEITQTYLISEEKKTARVRKRVYSDRVCYTKTEKVRINDLSALETESSLTEAEYESELEHADTQRHPIIKTRILLRNHGHVFEIDLYPFWKKQAVMEVELGAEDESFEIPEGIEILREVTSDKKYKNAALARSVPKED